MAKKPPAKAATKTAAKKVEKYETIDALVAGCNSKSAGAIQYGAGTFVPVEAISTGLANVDTIVGCLGIPRKRIVEVFGNESSGKTTLCLQCAAACQAQGGVVAFIDAEHAIDPDWARKNGVNVEKLLLSQPDSGDQAFTMIELMVVSGLIDMVIIDSIAALVPKEELEGESGSVQIGAQARMIGKALRKLVSKCGKSKATVIFINQLRDVVGGFQGGFTKPEMTPGGRALKFYASLRIQLRKAETLRQNEQPYAQVANVKIVKNKVAPPFRSTTIEIHFGAEFLGDDALVGVDKAHALMQAATDTDVIEVRGSNYYLGDVKLGIGKDKTLSNLRENPDMFKAVYEAVYAAVRAKVSQPAVVAVETDSKADDDKVDEGDDAMLTDPNLDDGDSEQPKDTGGGDGSQYLDND